MISLLWPFSTVAFYAYFIALLRHICHLFFRDISLKSQELSALFFVTFQWILFCLIFSVELSLLVILLFR